MIIFLLEVGMGLYYFQVGSKAEVSNNENLHSKKILCVYGVFVRLIRNPKFKKHNLHYSKLICAVYLFLGLFVVITTIFKF